MNKWLSIATSATIILSVAGCNKLITSSNTVTITALKNSVSVPTTDIQKRQIRVATGIKVDSKEEPLSYKTILRTGDTLSGETFGLLKDENDKPIKLKDGSNYICNGQFGGSGPDHTEFIQKGSKLFMITQFECQIGAIYQAELEQNLTTGTLKAKNLKFISEKAYHGGWVHCAGTKTTWNSFLGSEEYNQDAKDINKTTGKIDAYYNLKAPYFDGNLTKSNPYYYNYITEITIDKNGNDTYTKHYSMGRFSHELAYVMPDSKTAYLADDGTNDGFYMYVADVAGKLNAGTLYAAKWNQTSSVGAGKADITWVKLGHATDAELKTIVDKKPLFTDIFDSEDANASNECPTAGYKHINTQDGLECLKVKPGKEKEAAFLETRRWAAYNGATTEFRKFEGITYDKDNNKLYTSMSQIANGMEDFKKDGKVNNKYDKGGNNDIKLTYNKCGAVYGLDLQSKVKDANGNVINSAYVVTTMKSVIAGKPKNYAKNSPYSDNSCDVNSIANPDNLTYKAGSNLLLIGEDTDYHQNDALWTFNTKTNSLMNRILTTPYGSEVTSPMFQAPVNGFSYINMVTQHPYGESDQDKKVNPNDVQSYVGYMQIGSKSKI